MNFDQCIVATGATRTRFGETPRYPEGLYDLGHNAYAWMVPNGSWGESNAGLVIGEGEALLVDTLWDHTYTRTMLDAMQRVLDGVPITTVVNTHADGDHFWGNALLPDADAVTSAASLAEMQTTRPQSMVLFGRVGRLFSAIRFLGMDKTGHWFQAMGAPYDFAHVTHAPAGRTFSGEMTLTVGGRTVHLIEVGPAHTHGDLMVHVPDAKLLYSADVLFIDSTPVMWAGPVENWLAALDRILTMDVETIVPGHGPLTDKEGVRRVRSYWEFVAEAVTKCYRAGLSPAAAARAVVRSAEFVRSPFAAWNSPERMMTNAHTMYRHLRGDTQPPSVLQLIDIMRRQALLAHELPNAQPQSLRKRNILIRR